MLLYWLLGTHLNTIWVLANLTSKQPYEEGTLIFLLLQVTKHKHKEVKSLFMVTHLVVIEPKLELRKLGSFYLGVFIPLENRITLLSWCHLKVLLTRKQNCIVTDLTASFISILKNIFWTVILLLFLKKLSAFRLPLQLLYLR